jgi:hypothetical protein
MMYSCRWVTVALLLMACQASGQKAGTASMSSLSLQDCARELGACAVDAECRTIAQASSLDISTCNANAHCAAVLQCSARSGGAACQLLHNKVTCDDECAGMAFVPTLEICTSCTAQGGPVTPRNVGALDPPAFLCGDQGGDGAACQLLHNKATCDDECAGMAFVPTLEICTSCTAQGGPVTPRNVGALDPPAFLCGGH